MEKEFEVVSIVEYIEGLTLHGKYIVLGITFDEEMYIIDDDNDRLSVFGKDLFNQDLLNKI